MTKLLPASTLDQFKYEIAQELGLDQQIKTKGWGEMSSRDCGKIGGKVGGSIVKVMIKEAERSLNGN
ncbi:MAG: alpha/beta-type small acid-soluble spore protein [Bacillota bacterium]|nr:alpha/beta-type small acid-soluble spore protein [Bacillota bacterium]